MCLAVLALHMHPRWPLVIAANRDEFHDRPALPMHWWDEAPVRILAGKDLSAGGTWMGLSEAGRIALLTNVRAPQQHRQDAPSRGALVTHWLSSRIDVQAAAQDYQARGCKPFNLLMADTGGSRWWWTGDGTRSPQALGPGLYGLSNARLDTPWPKVERLKTALSTALRQAQDDRGLTEPLLALLGDSTLPPDNALPDTGVGIDVERFLAPAFIAGLGLQAAYGTRASTVMRVDLAGKTPLLRVTERTFGSAGAVQGANDYEVEGWGWE